MPKFHNKRIIVTGASKGLGAVAAQALAQEGARMVLMARSQDKLEEVRLACRNSQQHQSLSVDFFNMQDIGAGVHKAKEFLGGVDVVVHAAGGGLGFREDLISHEELSKLFMLNLAAPAEINRLIGPEMKERRSGNLVHVGSIVSSEALGSVGYNTVKSGLAAYVRTLGRELARYNVVATGILPGGFLGPGNAMERLRTHRPEAYDNLIKERLPRQIMGDAKELIPMILLLCSEDASMMGGCLVPIDAGEGRAYVN